MACFSRRASLPRRMTNVGARFQRAHRGASRSHEVGVAKPQVNLNFSGTLETWKRAATNNQPPTTHGASVGV